MHPDHLDLEFAVSDTRRHDVSEDVPSPAANAMVESREHAQRSPIAHQQHFDQVGQARRAQTEELFFES